MLVVGVEGERVRVEVLEVRDGVSQGNDIAQLSFGGVNDGGARGPAVPGQVWLANDPLGKGLGFFPVVVHVVV